MDDKYIEHPNGGKNRYDKNTTHLTASSDRNDLPVSRGKGRQSIPVIEEAIEERLPVNTRFPPRSAITPSVQIASNIDETTKRISVKRPSLELVDSQSFNRGDKGQTKSRAIDNDIPKINDLRPNENIYIAPMVTEPIAHVPDISEATTIASDNEVLTTQAMDKVALDLYAHLVNENSNDAVTGPNPFDVTTLQSLVRNIFAMLGQVLCGNDLRDFIKY